MDSATGGLPVTDPRVKFFDKIGHGDIIMQINESQDAPIDKAIELIKNLDK